MKERKKKRKKEKKKERNKKRVISLKQREDDYIAKRDGLQKIEIGIKVDKDVKEIGRASCRERVCR